MEKTTTQDSPRHEDDVRSLKVKTFTVVCENGIEISSETDKPSTLRLRKNGRPIAGAYEFRLNGSYLNEKLLTVELLISRSLIEKMDSAFPETFVRI